MPSVGAHLRQLRETRGISLEEIARATRVNSSYLIALETDDHASLPVPVFTRGFIRAYCQALGEPPDQSLALYDGRGDVATAVAPAPHAAPVPPSPPRAGKPDAVRRTTTEPVPRNRGPVLVSFILLVVLGVALFAVTLVLQSGREPGEERRTGRAPVRPEEAPATGTPSAVSTHAPANPAASAPAAPAGYRLVARAVETTWMRVRTEDGKTIEETIPAGQTREWFSTGPFTLTVGNAGGVNLELNGRALPPLGASGVVIPRIVVPSESQ
jgi:cytoskeletal protein RodZ